MRRVLATVLRTTLMGVSWPWRTLASVADRADIFVFAGLTMLGYGLYLKDPWVAFTIVGSILFLLGIAGARKAG